MMNFHYDLYVADTETTGLDFEKNDIIELSLFRLSDDVQKTWLVKPFNFDTISPDAMRVNGHKIEDVTHQTKYGKDSYLEPSRVVVEVENWIMQQGYSRECVFLIGQNIQFDYNMMQKMWKKCGAEDSFPFGRRMLDTMQFEIFMDIAQETRRDSYSLGSIIKKYGIKNDKAHSAAADTKATKELFVKQLSSLQSLLKK